MTKHGNLLVNGISAAGYYTQNNITIILGTFGNQWTVVYYSIGAKFSCSHNLLFIYSFHWLEKHNFKEQNGNN